MREIKDALQEEIDQYKSNTNSDIFDEKPPENDAQAQYDKAVHKSYSVNPTTIVSGGKGMQFMPGENIVWDSGSSKANNIVGTITRAYSFIFGLCFVGFAVFWMSMAVNGSKAMSLFGIPFVIAGIYVMVHGTGKTTKQTRYYITNKRVVAVQGRKSIAHELWAIQNIVCTVKSGSRGTITFDVTDMQGNILDTYGLYMVADAHNVCDILTDAVAQSTGK